MPKIVRFHETGGADVLKVEDLPLTEPGEGEVRLKVEAIGLPSCTTRGRSCTSRQDVLYNSLDLYKSSEQSVQLALRRGGDLYNSLTEEASPWF